jgi:flagellar basal-body rod protein FlgC
MSNVSGFPPSPHQGLVRPMFRTLGVSASGLSAQRARLEVIASNIANAETTRTDEGGPYRRRVVRLEANVQPERPFLNGQPGAPLVFRLPSGNAPAVPHGVRVAAIEEDAAEGPLVYDPGHPDADANGYVRYPNVRLTEELVDLLQARRIYEANATVFQSAKAMLRRALEI